MPKKQDLTGQVFGRLTALEPTDQRKGGHVVWACRCSCGNMTYTTPAQLKAGYKKSCGCLADLSKTRHFAEGTCIESIRSKKLFKNNTSGVRGVYPVRGGVSWGAQITFQGKTRFLGHYPTIQKAQSARQQAEVLFEECLARYDQNAGISFQGNTESFL